LAVADSLTRGITWLGHASFLIESVIRIYIDPFDLPPGLPPADLILVTHDHHDHLSAKDMKPLIVPNTVVVAGEWAEGKLPDEVRTSRIVEPGDTLTVAGVHIRTVPAYNTDKKYHPRKKGYVGYVFNSGGVTYYHAGDTDLIPEMEEIEVDVAMVPIGGTYTMSASEAAEAINLINPKAAIPMHWGKIVGDAGDVKAFRTLTAVPVVELEVPRPRKTE
jgi:L-ascorbate metabolism protein UlaG (beta-lactamase superfamily)